MIVAVFVQYQASVRFHTLIPRLNQYSPSIWWSKKTFDRYKSHFLFVRLIQWCSNRWQANPTTTCDIYSLSSLSLSDHFELDLFVYFSNGNQEEEQVPCRSLPISERRERHAASEAQINIDSVEGEDHLWTCSIRPINRRQIDHPFVLLPIAVEDSAVNLPISDFVNGNPVLILDIWVSMTENKIQLFIFDTKHGGEKRAKVSRWTDLCNVIFHSLLWLHTHVIVC